MTTLWCRSLYVKYSKSNRSQFLTSNASLKVFATFVSYSALLDIISDSYKVPLKHKKKIFQYVRNNTLTEPTCFDRLHIMTLSIVYQGVTIKRYHPCRVPGCSFCTSLLPQALRGYSSNFVPPTACHILMTSRRIMSLASIRSSWYNAKARQLMKRGRQILIYGVVTHTHPQKSRHTLPSPLPRFTLR